MVGAMEPSPPLSSDRSITVFGGAISLLRLSPPGESATSAALLAFAGTLVCPAIALAQWRADVAVNPGTNARIEYAVTTGSGGEPGLVGAPTLSVYCDGGAVLYFESTGTFFITGGEPFPVDVRVDQNDPLSVTLLANGDGTGGTTNEGDVLGEIVPQMRAGGSMALRARDFLGISYEYSFSLIGFTAASEQLACFADPVDSPPELLDAASEPLDDPAAPTEEEAQFVGHRITKFWYRIDDPCWRRRIPEQSRIFFRTLDEANQAGYLREGRPCGR
jgi:hypothetical protein